MAFEFRTADGGVDVEQKTPPNPIQILGEVEKTRRAQQRASFTNKRACMPQENTCYDIEDLLDVLYTDMHVRDILDSYDETRIRGMTVGARMQLFASGNELRFILERTAEGYVFTGVLGVTPVNDRSGCCNGSSQDLRFGMSFMALGGNSFPGRAR